MPDVIGNIEVPEIAPSGTFPLAPDYPHGQEIRPEVFVHAFGSANAKIEQRFWRGNGARRFRFVRRRMTQGSMDALIAFWEARAGAYQPFTYNVPADAHGGAATPTTVRFADPTLTIDQVSDAISSVGLVFEEIVDPGDAPSYSIDRTLTRFPDAALESALLPQVQTIIPLIRIRVKDSGVDDIFLSDRRVTVGANLYLPRLLTWNGISQSRSDVDAGAADAALFEFGNADRVMTLLANDTDLRRARIEFSLFHVDELTKLDLWAGEIVKPKGRSGDPVFTVEASDALRELHLTYPRRKISRRCWKLFDDGNACPYTAEGSGGDPAFCDRGFDTPDGCEAHGMTHRFGGIIAKPQTVRIRDNGLSGRPTITASSIVGGRADSVYGEVLPEVFTESDMPVPAKIVAGIDESDFFQALAVVCEGPIGAYASPVYPPSGSATSKHKLDNQPWHGFKDAATLGLVFDAFGPSLGPDPNTQPFGLSYTGDLRAAGTAFIAIRRSDIEGIQLSQLEEHEMTVVINAGRRGFTWSAPGSRASGQSLDNPVWVLINVYLRALNLEFADTATQEQYFDVDAALAEAAICNTVINRLIGAGTTKQFLFQGILAEAKPLRDWLQEICNNFQGFYTFSFGKLRVGMRRNSSVLEAFTTGNMILDTLDTDPITPEFNHLVAYFADKAFDFRGNECPIRDDDHAVYIGNGANPLVLDSQMNLVGTSTLDQAARIVTTRLREELGGINEAQWKAARAGRFRTTVLALAVEPGQVISVTHPDMPGGAGEGRVTSWRLNPDYSIDIEFRTTVDEMYDLTVGPKPADVTPDPVPDETVPDIPGLPEITAPGPVTSLTLGTVTQDSEDPMLVRIPLTYAAPALLNEFDGVEVQLEAPTAAQNGVTYTDGKMWPQGWHRWTADPGEIVLRIPYPARAERWYVYAISRNPTTRAVFADRGEGSPTPFVQVDIPNNPGGGGTVAPNVTGVTATPGFLNVHRARSAQKRFTVTIQWTLPTGHANYSQLHSLRTVLVNVATGVEDFTFGAMPVDHDADLPVLHVTSSLAAPDEVKTYKARIYAINAFGQVSASPAESSTFQVGPLPDAPAVVDPAVVIGYDQFGGNQRYRFELVWTLPTGHADYDEGFEGVEIFALPTGSMENPTSLATEAAGVEARNTDYWERPDLDADYDITFVPFNPKGVRNHAAAVTVQVTVAGKSLDVNVPAVYNAPLVQSGAWWTVGFLAERRAGSVVVSCAASAAPEEEEDFFLAEKKNINAVEAWEVEITHSADGVSGLGTSVFTFPANADQDKYSYLPDPFGFWILTNQLTPIDLPNQGISQVRIRARNAFGWSAWGVIVGGFMPGGSPQFSGNGDAVEVPVVAALSSGTYYPNVSKSRRFHLQLTGNIDVGKGEYRSSSGTPGAGDNIATGQIFTVHIDQDTTGGRRATFDPSVYEGLDGKDNDTQPNRFTAYIFEKMPSGRLRCIGANSGDIA